MKYRIKNIRLENKQVTKARLIAKRRVCTALSPYISLPQRVHAEKIFLEYLFDVGALPEAKRPSPFRRFLDRISRLTAKMRKGAKSDESTKQSKKAKNPVTTKHIKNRDSSAMENPGFLSFFRTMAAEAEKTQLTFLRLGV